MIGIIDVGTGNLLSLSSAVEINGFDSIFIRKFEDYLDSITHLIIPGVGSFSAFMNLINANNLDKVIHRHSQVCKPILGICLGAQVLCEKGFEGGECKGLGLIPGQVKKLNSQINGILNLDQQVGWNNIEIQKNHIILNTIKSKDFYFNHSYYMDVDEDFVLSITNYGVNIPAMIYHEHIVGVQFHPEKSLKGGLKIIENFLNWNGKQC